MTSLKNPLDRWTTSTEPSVDLKFSIQQQMLSRGSPLLNTTHQVMLGDSRSAMDQMEDQSVHLVVTSPPYWNLKEYQAESADSQLGHIDDRREFLDSLNEVWKRCYDLLLPGGRLCIVVGDVCRSRKAFGRHIVEPLHAYLQVECQHLGFDPLSPIIWHKIANMKTEMGGGGATLGKPYEPNAVIKSDIEYVLLFRKPGGYRRPSIEQRALSMISKENHQRWFQQIWTDVTGEMQRGHPAPYPTEVPRRLIGMYSFVGDTILDPFLGTGTTTAAAMQMQRNSIGIEVEPSYINMARKRLAPTLDAQVVFSELKGDAV